MSPGRPYTFTHLLSILGGEAFGRPPQTLAARFLLTDSRQLAAPDQTLFFALRTAKNDGHRYIPELLEKGVCLFVVEQVDPAWTSRYPEAGFVRVSSPLTALQQLAATHRGSFKLPVIGITGSNGKTIVKEWLAQLLGSDHAIARSPKSFNSQIGVPLSVWQINEASQLGIFEAGISEPGEMQQLSGIIRPTTGIFTNIGSAHDSGFDSRHQKIREKMRLFSGAETLVCCADHLEIIREVPPGLPVFSWGHSPPANIRIISSKKESGSTLVSLQYGDQQFGVRIPFTDEASVENAMHCISTLLLLKLSPEEIAARVETLQPVAMRLELKQGLNNCIIVNDSYNSDLNSLSIALDFLNSHSPGGKRTLILSDILQSGMPAPELYARVADLLQSKNVDRLIGIGPEISSCREVFSGKAQAPGPLQATPPGKPPTTDQAEDQPPASGPPPAFPAIFFPDTDHFLEDFDFSSFKDEAILLKGARVFGFERIGMLMQQKDHQTILEINLDALVHNLNVFRSMLQPGVLTMGMVKAFSYGSGSLEVARLLQYHQVDCLAVAYADEGKELRNGGITLPIVVMNPEVSSFDVLKKYRLEPEIYSLELLKRLAGSLEGKGVLPVHLKIDTGMHRLGFLPHQVPQLLELLQAEKGLKVSSVFSHFAASGESDHDPFTREQLQRFLEVCTQLEKGLGQQITRHICNSSAVSRFPEAHLDMVRLGIGLYGVSQESGLQSLLRNVSTFRSVVSQVKAIPKGQTIGYSRAWKAAHDMEVAIVPVGYADGLSRRLGNGQGRLLVGGRSCMIVGNVSMDSCAVDVTGLGVKPGDGVEVFGPNHPVAEFARDMDTIPYEVLTSVSQRVKRVYFQE
jgi:Alr-MurF fusion protein